MKENNAHKDREHALLSPSSAKQWMTCPGSIWLGKDCVEEESKFAAEGTKAHELAEKMLKHALGLRKTRPTVDEDDEDMALHAQGYVDLILNLRKKYREIIYEGIEERLHVTENIWGTGDYVLIGLNYEDEIELCAIDFKYGAGVEVSPIDNPQLKLYGLGAITKAEVKTVRLFIHQPRAGDGKPERFDIEANDLIKWFQSKVVPAEELALSFTDKNPPKPEHFVPGDHCRFCRAREDCEYRVRSANDALLTHIDQIDPALPDVHRITVERLVIIQQNKKRIEDFLKSVESHLMRRLQTGFEVPGFKLVESKGKRAWIEDMNQVAIELRKLGVTHPVCTHTKIITIGAAEKLIGKGKINHLTEVPEGRVQIVPIEDDRNAVASESTVLALLD